MNFLYNGSNTATKAINLYSKLRTFLLLAIKQQYKKLLLARSFMLAQYYCFRENQADHKLMRTSLLHANHPINDHRAFLGQMHLF